MFVAHFAIAFAARSRVNGPSLAVFVLAAQFIDLLWPLLLLAGIESVRITPGHTAATPLEFISYPYSHSLLMVFAYAVTFALACFIRSRSYAVALLIGLSVMSHWLLDLISHIPDLPFAPWSTSYVGLGLWKNLTGSLVVEGGLYVIGVYMYFRSFRPAAKSSLYGFWIMVFVLLILWLMSFLAAPPPSESSVAIGALFVWLFIPWAYFVDRQVKSA